jgi:NlpC/P60 family
MPGNSNSTYANANGYGLGAQAVAYAARFLGVPYVFGGESPQGFDCSGLVQYVYERLGVKLPRTADLQANVGPRVALDQLQPGDLVFSAWDSDVGANGVGHVGIYAGNGQILEASHTGVPVHYVPFNATYQAHTKWATRPGGGAGAVAVPADYSATPVGIPGVDQVVSGLNGFAETIKNLALITPFVLGGAVLVVWGLAKASRGSE